MIAADDLLLNFISGFGGVECSDLYFPFSSTINRRWSGEDVHLDPRRSGLPHVHCFGGGEREIEHALADEWSAVGDAHNGRGASFYVRDAHDTVQRQRAMRGGH